MDSELPPPASGVTLEIAPTFSGMPSVAVMEGFDEGTEVHLGMVRTNPFQGSCAVGRLGCARWRNPVYLGNTMDGWLGFRAPRDRAPFWIVAAGTVNGLPGASPVIEVSLVGRASDPDRDGLPDALEIWEGLDPDNPDFDNDGLVDGAEWPLAGLDPRVPDTDGDGLLDGEEGRLGLDPGMADSDQDGLDDAREFMLGTDPLNPDTDGDDARDGIEVGRHLDPLDPDSDDDGLLDGADPWLLPGPTTVHIDDAVPVSDVDATLADPEFDPYSGRFAWQVGSGARLFVGQIDLATGAFVPSNGRGELVTLDVGAMGLSFNGPEWVWTPTGMQLLFTRPVASGDPVLWTAWETPTGWDTRPLPGTTFGTTPFGALDPDGASGVLYAWGLRQENLVAWRPLDHTGGFVLPGPQRSVRWAPGRQMVAVRDIDGLGVVHLVDLFGQEVRVSDTVGLDHFEAMAIEMPELGGELVVVASRGPLYDSPSELAVYRLIDGEWREWHVLQGPPSHTHVVSPEVFVWEGRSYTSFLASKRPRNFDDGRSEVWVMSLDPAQPLAHRVSVTTGEVLKDPEPFTGGQRPWIYYTEVRANARVIWKAELDL